MLQQFRLLLRVALRINGAGGFCQQAHTETGGERIQNTEIHTKIGGEPGDINICHPAGTQISGKAGVMAVAVIKKRAVTVNTLIHPLAENSGHTAGINLTDRKSVV